jgi:type IV secretory pathway TraG/TraD family ATPase VirD4
MTGRPRQSSDNLEPIDQLLLLGITIITASAGAAFLLGQITLLVGGHPDQRLTLAQCLTGAAAWPQHLTDPAAGYPTAARTALPGPAGMWFAALTTVTIVVALVILGLHLLRRWSALSTEQGKRDGRTRVGAHAGMASRHDVQAQLSEKAVRTRAAHTRPSQQDTKRHWSSRLGLGGRVSRGGGRSFPTTAVGLRLGRDLNTRLDVWGSVEDSYLILGPPRSGKGIHLVIPHALDAPGPLLVTSTRPDTFHATRTVRETRGPVLAFDPQQLVPDAPRLRWSPTRGCADPLVAINRARALAAGAALHSGTTSDADFWAGMTAAVLRAYLHAAALTDRPMGDVLAWASRPLDPTPVRILRSEPDAAGGWAEELAAQASADPRQRDSVWAGVRRAVDSLADPRVLATCSPTQAEAFDPTAFLREHGSLYLLGATGTQLSVAPLITALLEDLLDTARTLAAGQPGGRLDPPLLLLLDEAANIAPIPSLPNLLSDGGGTGITTVTVLQSLAQARARWGEAGADAMWDASTTKVILGGLAHAEDLQRISRLAGDIDVPQITRSTSHSGASRSISSQRLPALPLERIRCLPAGHALDLARRCPPLQAQLTPWWQHPTQTNKQTKNETNKGGRRAAPR